MNKQEILTAINKTIKGQGSAVDVGGKLASILESIVDLIPEGGGGNEPLIVNGTITPPAGVEGIVRFKANDGEPSFAEATQAFLAGRTVLLLFPSLVSSGDAGLTITNYDDDGGGYGTFLMGEGSIDYGPLGLTKFSLYWNDDID